MKRLILSAGLLACMLSQFLPCAARADECDEILKGIYTELHYKSAKEFQLDFKRILDYSEQQREEARQKAEAEGSIGVLKILTLGFGGGQESEAIKELRRKIHLNEQLAWKSAEYENFVVKFA